MRALLKHMLIIRLFELICLTRYFAAAVVVVTTICSGGFSHAQSTQPVSGQPLLESSVERQTVIDGESVLLYVKGEHLTQLPDVSSLSKEFDVLDSRRSNSQVIEGGAIKSQFLMRFELLPKNLGQTTIPAFEADGITTQPITIDVVERGTPGAVPRDKVFAEVAIDKDNAYVQAQIVMSLHILDDGSLASVDPPLPVIPDVQVERLPGGDQRIEERDGEEYRVHTWRYALFPQKHGTIEIPRLLIPGSVRDPGYGGGLIMRSMATRRIQIRTSPVTFEAMPRAAASTADWWLPVQSLQLQHQWSADIANVMVGEPLTLTLAVTTFGATSNQLPEITVPALDGLKIYPDVPELQSQPNDDGLISQRQEKWSVIPQRAGEVSLPAISLKWWDTEADLEREAILPAQTLVVSADPNAAAEPPPVVDSQSIVNPGTQVAVEEPVSAETIGRGPLLWKTIALFALSGWLVTAISWAVISFRRSRRKPDHPPAELSADQLLRELRKASEGDDRSLFRVHLMNWARHYWPGELFSGPLDIATRLADETLLQELKVFEASLYADNAASADLKKIYRQLRQSLDNVASAPVAKDLLPSL